MSPERQEDSVSSTATSRRTYADPPVHEVVLDLRFQDELNEEGLEAIPEELGDAFGDVEPDRTSSFELQAGFGSPIPNLRTESRFAGWEYRTDDPLSVLRAQQGQFTMHSARSEEWPRGSYIGWERIFERYLPVVRALERVYGSLGIRRAGLRYLNRIALPLGSSMEEWFTLQLPDPPSVEDLYAFAVEETWERIVDFAGLSTKIRLAKIKIPDEELAAEHFGVLLDIDVFNLLVEDAPEYEDVGGWFERAHDAENRVFESCITEALRQTFNPSEDE